MTILEKIKETKGKSLLIFNHGLGDFCNFLPVFIELQKQTKRKIYLGADKKRQFNIIYPEILSLDKNSNLKEFDFVYTIRYPEPISNCSFIEQTEELSKPYICAYFELGMSEFVWCPYIIQAENKEKNNKRIGLHFFGHTSKDKKFCSVLTAETIWEEIKELGYEPFEIHQISEKKFFDSQDTLKQINESNSLRFQKANLRTMIEEINKCQYFFGVDSGPVYLALSILKRKNIMFLQNKKKMSMYVPVSVSTLDTSNYRKGGVLDFLTSL